MLQHLVFGIVSLLFVAVGGSVLYTLVAARAHQVTGAQIAGWAPGSVRREMGWTALATLLLLGLFLLVV